MSKDNYVIDVGFVYRWLCCRLAVRFFHDVLKLELKIQSVGVFSLGGISIQFPSQHTLVGLDTVRAVS